MKIIVIDGQGGKMGKLLIEKIKLTQLPCELIAIGTNSLATAAMLKAGADYGATGENPMLVNCKDAHIIVGPIGIVLANSLLGEITPAMAQAVGASAAAKILIPVNKCNTYVVGQCELPLSESITLAVEQLEKLLQNR